MLRILSSRMENVIPVIRHCTPKKLVELDVPDCTLHSVGVLKIEAVWDKVKYTANSKVQGSSRELPRLRHTDL
jgi:hypothetical protein